MKEGLVLRNVAAAPRAGDVYSPSGLICVSLLGDLCVRSSRSYDDGGDGDRTVDAAERAEDGGEGPVRRRRRRRRKHKYERGAYDKRTAKLSKRISSLPASFFRRPPCAIQILLFSKYLHVLPDAASRICV